MAYTVRQRKTLDPSGQALAEKDDDQEAEVLDTEEQEQLIEDYERSHRKYTKFYRISLAVFTAALFAGVVSFLVSRGLDPWEVAIEHGLAGLVSRPSFTTSFIITALSYFCTTIGLLGLAPGFLLPMSLLLSLWPAGVWARLWYQHRSVSSSIVAPHLGCFILAAIAVFAEREMSTVSKSIQDLRKLKYDFKKA